MAKKNIIIVLIILIIMILFSNSLKIKLEYFTIAPLMYNRYPNRVYEQDVDLLFLNIPQHNAINQKTGLAKAVQVKYDCDPVTNVCNYALLYDY